MTDKIKVRFIQLVGHRKVIYKYWGWRDSNKGCYHRTKEHTIIEAPKEQKLEFEDSDWDQLSSIEEVCETCGTHPAIGEEINRTGSIYGLYNTASGRPEPGDGYYADNMSEDFWWDNPIRPVIVLILPNGVEWFLNSRANNCSLPNDRTHRCWCITGSLEDGTLNSDGKNCHTCSAGAGSIQGGKYHGFLRHGYLCKE
jgi:hypothetical protein